MMYRALLVVAVLIRLLLLALVPVGGTVAHGLQGLSDEESHFRYVQYLAEHHRFPIQSPDLRTSGGSERTEFEYYQPPLYYLLCAPMYALMPSAAALYACRFLSFVGGILSLVVLSRILGRLCSSWRRRQGVLFAALLPSHAYTSALVTNDCLSWLFGVLLTDRLLALVDLVRNAPDRLSRPGIHTLLGVLLGLGMLTKSSMAIFYPVIVFVYGYAFLRSRRTRVLAWGLLTLAVSLALAGGWYARNIALYGSIAALDVGYGPTRGLGILSAAIHLIRAGARSFWFPMQHVEPSTFVSVLRAVGIMILVAHTVVALGYLKGRGITIQTGTLGLLVVVALAAQLYISVHWMDVGARLMFPALAGIVFLFVVPMAERLARWQWSEKAITIYCSLLALHGYVFLLFARSS